MYWRDLFDKQGGMSPAQFDEITHPNGTTALTAAMCAALALQWPDAEVVKGWDGINADELERIMRTTVRKLVRTYSEMAELHGGRDAEVAAKALAAVQGGDDFATAAAFALPGARRYLEEAK